MFLVLSPEEVRLAGVRCRSVLCWGGGTGLLEGSGRCGGGLSFPRDGPSAAPSRVTANLPTCASTDRGCDGVGSPGDCQLGPGPRFGGGRGSPRDRVTSPSILMTPAQGLACRGTAQLGGHRGFNSVSQVQPLGNQVESHRMKTLPGSGESRRWRGRGRPGGSTGYLEPHT